MKSAILCGFVYSFDQIEVLRFFFLVSGHVFLKLQPSFQSK